LIILGLNAYHADSSAAIFVDGRMVAAVEEERFTRVKHWAGFPARSVLFCLKEAGVSFDEVDHFAIGRDPRAKFLKKMLFLARNPFANVSAIVGRLRNSFQVSSLEQELAAISGLPAASFKGRIRQVEHHRSHLASAFYASPFNEAACLSIDGSGDFTTTMTAFGKGNDLQILDSVDFPHSLGLFYTAFTQWLGFAHFGDEYKVMGLSPYGKPLYTDKILKLIKHSNDGLFKLELDYFRNPAKGIISYGEDHIPGMELMYNRKFTELFGPSRSASQPLDQFHKDMAASVQKVTEQTIFHILKHLQQATGCENLCLAGGVAQNSVANGKIIASTGFKNLYIPSASHDAGISMGSGLFVQHAIEKLPRQPAVYSAYTGPSYSDIEIADWLRGKGIAFEQLEMPEIYDRVTDALIGGAVAGWMQGRAEFGPRALGGRSILADPRRADAKDIINSKIKRRESFRPFAPSVLAEFAAEYFELSGEVPFMEKVFPVRKEKRELIPAVTHVDGSGRLQTVRKDISPRYYELIEVFRQKTGVPILLNTSFNENEPIVNTPEEAFHCFERTDMDLLIMGNIILKK
jgi:carbamoyltransferase